MRSIGAGGVTVLGGVRVGVGVGMGAGVGRSSRVDIAASSFGVIASMTTQRRSL
jgi:hypothetical protein